MGLNQTPALKILKPKVGLGKDLDLTKEFCLQKEIGYYVLSLTPY